MQGRRCGELEGWGGDAESVGEDLSSALLQGSRSLQKIMKVTWSESWDTETGQETALFTASGIVWCDVSGPTASVFKVTE